ncbi:uncharacterized protein LOC144376343 [Ictidomys tridecemlineatus]
MGPESNSRNRVTELVGACQDMNTDLLKGGGGLVPKDLPWHAAYCVGQSKTEFGNLYRFPSCASPSFENNDPPGEKDERIGLIPTSSREVIYVWTHLFFYSL